MSVTVTVKVHDAMLFAASFAVQVTVVVPTVKVVPDAGAQVTVAEPQLSVAVGEVNVATAEQLPFAAGREMFVGQAPMEGF